MTWVACAIGGAAVVGAGAGVYSSNKASKAASGAASSQMSAQNYAIQMQMDYLRQMQDKISRGVDIGIGDISLGTGRAVTELKGRYNEAMGQFQPFTGLEEYNAARQLLQDPSSIMQRPGVQFQREQGEEALQGAFSRTSGGGASGVGMKAAVEYGQNFASTALDAELNRLFPFINTSMGARTNIANLQQGLGSNLANIHQGYGRDAANLRVGGITGTAGITGQMMPSIAQGITNQGNIAATGQINQANIQTGLYSNLAGMGSNMAMMYAMNPGLFSGGGGGGNPYQYLGPGQR